MARSKRWILTKSCDYQPGGSLQLGQILAKPKYPSHALQPAGPLPLPQGLIVEHTSCEDLDVRVNDELAAHFDAWASFYLVSTNTEAVSTRSKSFSWHFDKLDSITMTPSLDYVRAAMGHGDVPASLKKWSFSMRVYMVTGVRIVSGARISRSNEAEARLSGSAQVSLNTGIDPVGAGAGLGSKSSHAESVGRTSDFVFAYRLNEIRYRGKITHEPYNGGELSSTEAKGPSRPEIIVDGFEVLGICEDSWKGNARDFDQVTIASHEDLECYLSK
ncbi:hypothetical protein M406DRAFT_262729 [Cryphonectria parasitica EP155]|uniref:Uncharacterized protein n=1 Tax=Cryphonectria parasitica (strain ATCC 38755 / EP155) TaxID=660469 RepID=A0A9P5CLT4_CRYP1|nr:uncharacterized protein M406DRAFT_262729 [Cryphonectria parasitica EP155]KAF3763413.1 hypothetical protein M406DRAFT_262729 [Cryphonectria parasitica EP155]